MQLYEMLLKSQRVICLKLLPVCVLLRCLYTQLNGRRPCYLRMFLHSTDLPFLNQTKSLQSQKLQFCSQLMEDFVILPPTCGCCLNKTMAKQITNSDKEAIHKCFTAVRFD